MVKRNEKTMRSISAKFSDGEIIGRGTSSMTLTHAWQVVAKGKNTDVRKTGFASSEAAAHRAATSWLPGYHRKHLDVYTIEVVAVK